MDDASGHFGQLYSSHKVYLCQVCTVCPEHSVCRYRYTHLFYIYIYIYVYIALYALNMFYMMYHFVLTFNQRKITSYSFEALTYHGLILLKQVSASPKLQAPLLVLCAPYSIIKRLARQLLNICIYDEHFYYYGMKWKEVTHVCLLL